MPTRKGTSSKKGAKKAARKGASKGSSGGSRALRPQPMYAVAVREAIAGGDAAAMKRTAAAARKHIADVQKALQQLEKKMGKS